MATQVQFRRGNTIQHSTFAGAVAEVTVDTDKKVLVVHDGVTQGGTPLATIANVNLSTAASNAYAQEIVTAANNWSNNKVDTITSNSNSRVWANSVVSSGIKTVFVDLASSGVTSASYGGATQIPSITVDEYGRITYAANVTVQGMDYEYVNTSVTGANNYSNNIGTAGNNYINAVGASVNAYSVGTFVKLTSSQQTITGDLAITGNLTFLGNAVTITSNNLVIGDSFIYLAANNYSGTDLVDIGFIGNYGNNTGANVHTGLFRDHASKEYFLFQGYDAEPSQSNDIIPYSNNMVNAILNTDIKANSVIINGMNVYSWISDAYGTANTKLANTSGITFNGDFNTSGNLSAEGTTFFVNAVTNRVGIGRTDPGYSLDVVGTVNATALLVNGAALSGGATLTNETASSSTYYPVMTTAISGSMTVANTSNSKLYFVPSTGTLSATVFNSLSDRNLKDNIENFDGRPLADLINPVTFNWKDNGNKSYGVIAQELENVLPELVETNEQGVKSVSYIPLIAILIDVIQKQGEEIKEIKKRLNMEN